MRPMMGNGALFWSTRYRLSALYCTGKAAISGACVANALAPRQTIAKIPKSMRAI